MVNYNSLNLDEFNVLCDDIIKVQETVDNIENLNTSKVKESLNSLNNSLLSVLISDDLHEAEQQLINDLDLLSERLEALRIQIENK